MLTRITTGIPHKNEEKAEAQATAYAAWLAVQAIPVAKRVALSVDLSEAPALNQARVIPLPESVITADTDSNASQATVLKVDLAGRLHSALEKITGKKIALKYVGSGLVHHKLIEALENDLPGNQVIIGATHDCRQDENLPSRALRVETIKSLTSAEDGYKTTTGSRTIKGELKSVPAGPKTRKAADGNYVLEAQMALEKTPDYREAYLQKEYVRIPAQFSIDKITDTVADDAFVKYYTNPQLIEALKTNQALMQTSEQYNASQRDRS